MSHLFKFSSGPTKVLKQIENILNQAISDDELWLLLDIQYNILYASSSVMRILKNISIDLQNQNIYDVVADEDRKNIPSFDILESNDAQPYKCTLNLLDADGSYVWCEAKFIPLYINDEFYIVAIFKDMMLSLSNNISVFETLITYSDEAILILNPNGKIIFANHQMLILYGFTSNEINNFYIYDIDKEFNHQQKWELFAQTVKQKLRLYHTCTFIDVSGNAVEVEERWQFFANPKEEIYVRYIVKVSERKKNEEKIRKTLERQHILSQVAFNLNTHENFEFKINEALRIMGNFLNISRILIFQNILNDKAINCTFEWYDHEYIPLKNDLQAIPYSLLSSLHSTLFTNNYVQYSLEEMPVEIIPYFQPYTVYFMAAIPLRIAKNIFGFICFLDHQNFHLWGESEKRFIFTFSEILNNSFKQKYHFDTLLKSERRFRELAEMLPEMICEAAINGKLLFANKHAQMQFGFTENEISKGIMFFNFFHHSDKSRVIEYLERLLSGEHIPYDEFKIINREGKEVSVLLYMNIIMHNNLPTGLRAVMVNISERKEHEQYLERVARVFDDCPFIALEMNAQLEIDLMNKHAIDMGKKLNLLLEKLTPTIHSVLASEIAESLIIDFHENKFYFMIKYNVQNQKLSIYGMQLKQ